VEIRTDHEPPALSARVHRYHSIEHLDAQVERWNERDLDKRTT